MRDVGTEGREIRAQISLRVDAKTRDLALVVEREFGVGDVVATMGVGEERLGTLACPLDRTADLLRRPDADRLFGIDEDLRTETAAHVWRDHPKLVLRRDADEGGENEPRHMRVLARRVEREGVGARIVITDGRARLDGVRHQTIVDDVELGDMRGLCESRVSRGLVAKMPLIDRVVGRNVVDNRRALRHGGVHVDDRRQHGVIDIHLLGALARLRMGLGDDDGHVVANVAPAFMGDPSLE